MTVLDRIEVRALGALDLVDATTGERIARPLRLQSEGLGTVRNSGGLYAIVSANGFDEYAAIFDLDELPVVAPVDVSFEVSDLSRIYLTRAASVRLPRDPNPQNRDQPDSVFQPVTIAMYRAPAADTSVGWSVLRATVYSVSATLDPEDPIPTDAPRLPWVSMRVMEGTVDNGNGNGDEPPPRLLAQAMSDQRGEALIGIPGIPRFTWGEDDDDTVVKESCPLILHLRWDPRAEQAGWIPDPDLPDEEIPNLRTQAIELDVSAGRETSLALRMVIDDA